uniref:Beta/gamma crystallin 'Greek key' domain-containing protein n=1 Tax=Globodera pallida TaxID=36090 RepID=A0A183CMS3_GLOPA
MVRGESVLCLICLLLSCVAGRRAERRRHFVEIYRISSIVAHDRPNIGGLDLAQSLAERAKSKDILDKHCWIRIAYPRGKAVDVHGSCKQLSKGLFACQSKFFLDPHNVYCKFLDR